MIIKQLSSWNIENRGLLIPPMTRYFTWFTCTETLEGDNNSRSSCPITINLLHILKTRFSRSTSYIILEQCLLRAAFSLSEVRMVEIECKCHALLFQQPRVLIRVAGNPAAFAVEAASI